MPRLDATGDYSRQRALSASVDRNQHALRANETDHILHANGRSLLRAVAYFQKINGSERVKATRRLI